MRAHPHIDRNDEAFRFWMERDRCQYSFYDPNTGAPRVPFHPLARLQPHAPPHRLIAPYQSDMRILCKCWKTGRRGEYVRHLCECCKIILCDTCVARWTGGRVRMYCKMIE
eukprot:125215-Pelagomonas_calceolata.AAC.1